MALIEAARIADEIERNIKLDPPNQSIWFNDVQWALIVKALRAYDEHPPQVRSDS